MSNETKKPLPPTDVLTPPVRLAFPALFVPRKRAPNNDVLTYQATILLPPDLDLTPFKKAMVAAMEKKFGKVIQLPAAKNPIHDCEEKPYNGFAPGWRYIGMHNSERPSVFDRRGMPITDPKLVYPGCWVRIYTNAFAWDNKVGGKGVSFGLNGVQFVRDDDRLDGRRNPIDVFDPLDDLGDDMPGNESLDAIFG